MTEIGYFLSSEEHGPWALVDQARLAADAGIGSIAISDHFHPWLDDQGESPFVWSVIGAIAAATRLAVCTMVTCPILRIHPAIVAHAAATSSLLLDGRFELGIGTGERLNEQVLGQAWPTIDERLDRLEEAVEVMRRLWTGDQITHRGRHYTVEDARLYSCPPVPPRILVSAFGPDATDVAARIGDGFVSTRPDRELLGRYRSNGGRGLASAGVKVCWGPDEGECRRLAHRLWRSSGVPGDLGQDLRLPSQFEAVAQLVTEDDVAREIPCGPDPQAIVRAVEHYVDAGFDRVYLHQIGAEHRSFLEFFQRELVPALADIGAGPDADASSLDLRAEAAATH